MPLKTKFNPLKEQWQSLDVYAPDIAENDNCVFSLEDFFPAMDIKSGHLVHPGAISAQVPQFLNFEFLRLKERAFNGLTPRNGASSMLYLCDTYKEKKMTHNGLQLEDADGHQYFTANLAVIESAIAKMESPFMQKIYDDNKTGLQAALVAYATNNNYPVLFSCAEIAETDKALMAKVDRFIRMTAKAAQSQDPLPEY